jgi:hypothetical protein
MAIPLRQISPGASIATLPAPTFGCRSEDGRAREVSLDAPGKPAPLQKSAWVRIFGAGRKIDGAERWAAHQHRQEPRLRRGDRRAEEGRPAAERDPTPAGEVSQQPAGGRADQRRRVAAHVNPARSTCLSCGPRRMRTPRQAEAPDQADTRLPVDEDGLCDDQGL